MGIKGLFPFLKQMAPRSFRRTQLIPGRTMAVDGTGVATRFLYAAARHVAEVTDFSTSLPDITHVANRTASGLRGWLKDIMRRGVAVVFIMDGPERSPAKQATIAKRAAIKQETQRRFDALLSSFRAGEQIDMTSLVSLAARIDYLGKERFKSVIEETLRKEGLGVIYSTTEAERMCCMMALEGSVDYVWSVDSDVCVFMPPVLIRDGYDGTCDIVDCPSILQELNMSKEEFCDFCILCGCDFNENIPGIGPIKAFDLIQKYKAIENIPDSAFKKKSKAFTNRDCLNVDICRNLFSLDKSENHIYQVSGS